MKTLKSMLFLLRKKFEKEKSNGKYCSKNYSLRFIHNARFMNAFLDYLVNNLPDKIQNKTWIYYMKWKDCKKFEERKIM